MPDDRVAAALDEAGRIADLRRRHHHGHTSNPRRDYCTADNQDWPCDATRLLAAVEAVLKLTAPGSEIHRDLDGNLESPLVQLVRCDAVRETIRAALTGEEAGPARADGPHR
jgi:hypothetical protein